MARKSTKNYVDCLSADKCVSALERGKPAQLSPKDPRQQLSIESGYCEKCRKHYRNAKFLPYIETVPALQSAIPFELFPGFGDEGFESAPSHEAREAEGHEEAPRETTRNPLRDFLPDVGSPELSLDEAIASGRPVKAPSYDPKSLERTKAFQDILAEVWQEASESGLLPVTGFEGAAEALPTDGGEGGEGGSPATQADQAEKKRRLSAYEQSVVSHAEFIVGYEVESFEEAINIVARAARSEVDLIDAIDAVDRIAETHGGNVESAAVAVSLHLNNALVVADVDGGGADAIRKSAKIEGFEYQTVEGGDIRSLVQSLTEFPTLGSPGRVVIVRGLKSASSDFRRALISAVTNRKIGRRPVPKGVKVVVSESNVFDFSDYPSDIINEAILLAAEVRPTSALDEAKDALSARERMLRDQIEMAERARDIPKVERLKRLLSERQGFVGAWNMMGPAKADEKEGERARLRNVLSATISERPRADLHMKSALVIEAVMAENNAFRREVAERVLAGLGGEEYAAKAIENYLSANIVRLSEVLAEGRHMEEVERKIKADSNFASTVALVLRNSPLVEDALRKAGDAADRARRLFYSVTTSHPEFASGILERRPGLKETF